MGNLHCAQHQVMVRKIRRFLKIMASIGFSFYSSVVPAAVHLMAGNK
jgi:hypothetical protein